MIPNSGVDLQLLLKSTHIFIFFYILILTHFRFLTQILLKKEMLFLKYTFKWRGRNKHRVDDDVLISFMPVFFVEHADLLGPCPEDEAISPGDECMDAVLDESLLETCPIQSPLQVFAGMGGLALIAERLPMLYPDVIQQVSEKISTEKHANTYFVCLTTIFSPYFCLVQFDISVIWGSYFKIGTCMTPQQSSCTCCFPVLVSLLE